MNLSFSYEQFAASYSAALQDMMAIQKSWPTASGSLNLRREEIESWAIAGSTDTLNALDMVALGLAIDFQCRILTWEFCDRVANDLQGELWHHAAELETPTFFWQFFLAFDHSETAKTEDEAESLAQRAIKKLLDEVKLPLWKSDQSIGA